MAKPIIVKRGTKGSALTFTELDTNFQNLDDATITLKGGTGGVDVVTVVLLMVRWLVVIVLLLLLW